MFKVKDLPKEYTFTIIPEEIRKVFSQLFDKDGLTIALENYKVIYVKIINNVIVSVYASSGWFPFSDDHVTFIYGESFTNA